MRLSPFLFAIILVNLIGNPFYCDNIEQLNMAALRTSNCDNIGSCDNITLGLGEV